MNENLEGFGTEGSKYETKTSKKNKKKGGGFQSMGLSFPVLKGVQKRGYKVPTPIQRKTIPVVLDGRDVVAMARTGSGKTACFLLPMFEKLLNSVKKPGARGLILSPTRELALQTLKFIKEIGKFTNLKPAVILGGDAMDSQFAALHGNPDVIVATPGRLLHVCVEMELKLQYVQYVVFDEADRLFEMGFGEQLQELLKRLPEARQTLLFSATLPKMLVEFARAGLNEPALIRLDVESKIPEKLELVFLCCRTDEKVAALLSLLKHIIPSESQTVVFAATKHHVEYLKMVLDLAGISNCCIYSTMDPSARKINAAKFQVGKATVLIVTDIAARGLDIPQLDCVINFNFPAKPKLFVHRVGRCARAGRSGTAYSLVSSEEFPYLLDLHLFLGRPLQLDESRVIGSVPPSVVEEEQSDLLNWLTDSSDLKELQKTANNGYKSYLRTRPGASIESVRRVKELGLAHLKPHSIFNSGHFGISDGMKVELLSKIKSYRPNGTIFEIGKAPTSETHAIMREAKKKHSVAIASHKRKLEEQEQENPLDTEFNSFLPKKSANAPGSKLASPIASHHENKKRKKAPVDAEHFVPYQSADHHTEQGLMVNNFQTEAAQMQFDLTADSADQMKRQRNQVRWDRKKKKFVGDNQDTKGGKIQTESGVWIPASYKTDRYAQWKERNRIDANNESSDEDVDDNDPETQRRKAFMNKKFPNTHWGRHNEKLQRKMKSELKRPEQVLKIRQRKEKQEWKNKNKQNKKKKRSRKV